MKLSNSITLLGTTTAGKHGSQKLGSREGRQQLQHNNHPGQQKLESPWQSLTILRNTNHNGKEEADGKNHQACGPQLARLPSKW